MHAELMLLLIPDNIRIIRTLLDLMRVRVVAEILY